MKTWGEAVTRHFLKETIQMANRHVDKTLIITVYERNTNKYDNEIPSHTKNNGTYQKKKD